MQGIKVVEENILYNWTNNNTMEFSSSRKPFHDAKEMHAFTLKVLIGACSKPSSFVVDFATSALLLLHSSFILHCFLAFVSL
jgi:hypothetical protein